MVALSSHCQPLMRQEFSLWWIPSSTCAFSSFSSMNLKPRKVVFHTHIKLTSSSATLHSQLTANITIYIIHVISKGILYIYIYSSSIKMDQCWQFPNLQFTTKSLIGKRISSDFFSKFVNLLVAHRKSLLGTSHVASNGPSRPGWVEGVLSPGYRNPQRSSMPKTLGLDVRFRKHPVNLLFRTFHPFWNYIIWRIYFRMF